MNRKILLPLAIVSSLVAPSILPGGTLFAANVRLGSESAVSPIVPVAAAYDQTKVDVASNGVGYLAIWSDTRQQSPNGPILYATRLDNRGVPVERFGDTIAFSNGAPLIASDGRDYLIAYSTNDGTFVQKLDANGHALGEARLLSGISTPAAVASNGQSYLLATRDESSYTSVFVLVDRDGIEIRRFAAPIVPAVAGLASRNGGYVLIGVDTSSCRPQSSCTGNLALMAIDPSGVFSVQLLGGVARAGVQRVVAAFGAERILVATNTYQLVGYDGSIGKQTQFANGAGVLSAGWDGNEFMVAIRELAGRGLGERTSGIRIRADGEVVNATPFYLAGPTDSPRFATSSSGNIAVWSERGIASSDVLLREGSFADLETASTMPFIPTWLTMSAAAQRDPDMVADSPQVATWIEKLDIPIVTTSPVGANVRFGGETTESSSSAIAHGRDSYLLVWSDANRNVMASLFATDGTPIGETPFGGYPLLIAPTRSYPGTPIDLDVAWNGETFLIAWTDGALFGRRLDEDGTLRDAAPFPIVAGQDNYSEIIEKPSVVVQGDSFVIAASGRTSGIVDPGPWIPETGIWTNRVLSSDLPERPSGPSVTRQSDVEVGFQVTDVAQDVNEDGITIVWTQTQRFEDTRDARCIAATQRPGTAQRLLRCVTESQPPAYAAQPVRAAIAWNGIEHVLVWSEAGRAFAMRFDRNLNPLDEEPIAIAENVLAGSRVRAMSGAGGVTIAYARIDRAAGDVPRVFLRTLMRSDVPTPSRRRSTRP